VTIKLGVVALASPESGGTYQYTLSTLQALRQLGGFDITLYADPKNTDFACCGFPIVPFAEGRGRQALALAAHWVGLKLHDPFAREDVLLSPTYSLALLHTAKPFAYTLHDLQEKYYPENFSWSQRIWRHQVHARLLPRASRVICESRFVKKDIANFFAIDEARLNVMPAPPQPLFLSLLDEARLATARNKLGLPEKFLFFPAQFWPHKNHLRLVEAFRGVLDEFPDQNLVLTGRPRDNYHAVMDCAKRFGLGDSIHHLGYLAQEDLLALYQLATALVMPSLFESVSIPIYEAFQVGTPVIASRLFAIPEQVGDAAILFDPLSVTSIRDAILRLLRDPQAARKLSENGRARMLALTPEIYSAELNRVLCEMLQQTPDE
jgi:glycosyltransferase involved in cell wall biosynthesis